jgi:hypothetical protein
MIAAGTTFRCPHGGLTGDDRHVWVVISAPDRFPDDDVIVVNITTIYQGAPYDSACVLYNGDHPTVKHDSYIRYQSAVGFTAQRIQSAVTAGAIIILESIEQSVLDRIRLGAQNTNRMPRALKAILSRQGVI